MRTATRDTLREASAETQRCDHIPARRPVVEHRLHGCVSRLPWSRCQSAWRPATCRPPTPLRDWPPRWPIALAYQATHRPFSLMPPCPGGHHTAPPAAARRCQSPLLAGFPFPVAGRSAIDRVGKDRVSLSSPERCATHDLTLWHPVSVWASPRAFHADLRGYSGHGICASARRMVAQGIRPRATDEVGRERTLKRIRQQGSSFDSPLGDPWTGGDL